MTSYGTGQARLPVTSYGEENFFTKQVYAIYYFKNVPSVAKFQNMKPRSENTTIQFYFPHKEVTSITKTYVRLGMTPQEELCSFHQVVPVTEIRFFKKAMRHMKILKRKKKNASKFLTSVKENLHT